MIDFNKIIDQHLEREHRPKKIGNYYPSEIGKCIRKTWYSYLYPQQVDPDVMKIFESGNMVHDFIVEVLRNWKIKDIELLKNEMPIKLEAKGFTISGRVDDLILLKAENKLLLVEVKSTRDIRFVKKPDPSYKMQLQFYMHATGVHNGIILYVDKSNLQTKIFEVDFNENDSEEILKRFQELHNYLTEKELPLAEAKQFPEMKWMCKFCEYADKCKKDEK